MYETGLGVFPEGRDYMSEKWIFESVSLNMNRSLVYVGISIDSLHIGATRGKRSPKKAQCNVV